MHSEEEGKRKAAQEAAEKAQEAAKEAKEATEKAKRKLNEELQKQEAERVKLAQTETEESASDIAGGQT